MATAHPSDAALLSDLGFLRRLAWSLTREDAAADDLAQDATLIALERRPAEMRSPRAWLGRVVRNLAFNAHRGAERRQHHEAAVPQPSPVLTPEQHAARREMLEAVVSEVVLLDEPFGTVVMMRFYDELSPKEIAKRLGLPEGTVRSRLSRGLSMLRERLDSRVGPRDRWATVLAPAALWGGGAMGAGAKAAVAAVAAILILAPLAIWTFGNREHERTTGSGADHAAAAAAAPTSGAGPEPARSEVAAVRAPASIAPRPTAPEQDARPASDDPVPAPIRGVVVDADTREPIAGAEIAWMVVDPPRQERTAGGGLSYRDPSWDPTTEQALVARGRRLTSGSDGAFEIPGTPARVAMIAKHGDRFGAFRGHATSPATIRMAVDRSDWIEVKDQDGQPRAGVPVAIWRLGGPAKTREWRGVTGPDGRAEVRHAQQIRPDGRRTALAYGVDVFGEKPVEDATTTGPATVRLTLPRTAALRVSVTGAVRGSGARVTIRARRAPSQDEPGSLTEIVGPLGDVEFPFVAPTTEMELEASDADRGVAPASQTVVTSQPGGSVATVIALGDGGRRFRAIEESTGKPLPGRTLFRVDQVSSFGSDSPFVSTDSEGRGRIPAGEGGSIDLGLPDELRVRWLVAHIDVPTGAADDLGDVTFKIPPVLAAGRVKTADGAPAAGVNVRVEREAPSARGTPMGGLPDPARAVRTSTDGRFVLRGIARGKPLRVVAGGGGPSRNEGVKCDEGATGLEVVIARSPRSRELVSGIRGSIIVDRDVPLELLRATLSRKPEKGSPVQSVAARAPLRELPGGNEAGPRRAEFAFPGLEPGAYTFELQSVGGSDPVVTTRFDTSAGSTSFGTFGGFEGGVAVFEGPHAEVKAASAGDSGLENIDVRGRLRVVRARVADRAGKPVAGAEATVLTSETPARKVGGGTSDAQGRVVVVTSQGPHRIAVRASGYRSGVEPLGDGEQAIALRPGIPIRIVARPDAGAAPEGLSAYVEWTSNPAARAPSMTDEGTAIARLAGDGLVRFVDREGTLILSAPGDYRVMITSEPEPAAAGQPSFVARLGIASEVIHVKDSDAEQTFEIAVKPPEPASRKIVR